MPTIAFSKTVTKEHLDRAIPALKAHFGLPADATNAQVMAEWEKMVIGQIKGIVRDYEARKAAEAAADAVKEINLA